MATPDQIRARGRWSLVLGTLFAAVALTAVALASDVDVAVVDATAPTGSVTLAPGAGSPITINLAVTGAQSGTATFKVYRDWTLSGGVFTGANPQSFSVGPRTGGAPATTFSTSGTVTVNTGHPDGTFTLAVGAFDITNSNETGAKLEAGDTSNYTVRVETPPPSDTTPPVITPSVSGTPGSNGWYVSDVAVSWSVVDNESAISSSSGCGSTTVTADTAGATFTCTATSAGGTSSQSVTIKRDATKPTITGSASPPPNADGWNNTSVEVSFSCGDNLSGVDSCGPNATLAGEGRDQSVTGTAVDNAGNSETATVGGIDIDMTQPDVTATPSVAPIDVGGTEWYKDSVTFTWAASDPDLADSSTGSGVETGPTPATSTFSTTATGGSASSEATDYADNSGTGSVTGINVDASAPTAGFTDCPSSPLLLGSSAPTIHWTATDVGSGLSTASSGSVDLDTSTVGSKTASSPAPQDNVGHTGSAATCTYNVIFDFDGFFRPIDNLPAYNVVRAGQAIPVKFSLNGNQGLAIMAPGYPKWGNTTCDPSAPQDGVEETLTAGQSALTYDATSDQYVYVWKSDKAWAGLCRWLEVKLIDGTSHRALFKFTK